MSQLALQYVARRWTMRERAVAYARAFPQYPASHLHVVPDAKGRDTLVGVWVIGNDYRNLSDYYGAYPRSYMPRMMALFADIPYTVNRGGHEEQNHLHVFSGSLPAGPYVRLDINGALGAEVVGDVRRAGALFIHRLGRFELLFADPPYSKPDAERYGTRMINRRAVMSSLAEIASHGAFLVWLDTVWPMHRKDLWTTVGRIAIVRSTNHRIRMATIFQRTENSACVKEL